MKRKLTLGLLSLLLMAVCSATLYAQGTKVSGVVKDTQGEPIVGATVLQKGSKTNVAATGMDGTFTISVPQGTTLVFSFLGYITQEVRATNNMVVILQENANVLDDVVVTAEFGMKRVARSMGSSVQNVKAQDVIESGRTDFINALQGRVSGLTVTQTSGMPGASSTVVLRSITSLSGNNQPLYVVDGIPMDNSSFDPVSGFAVADAETYRTMDFASRGNDLSSDDIASITILKGAAAAALYGSDASNGAIIITTKKGTNTHGKGKITYRNQFSFSKAYGWPEVQNKYANGSFGATNYYYQYRWGGLLPENQPTFDNVAAVFQTGFSQEHNVSLESGTETMSIRAAARFTDSKGVVKTTDLTRVNLTLSGKAKIKPWLSMESSLQYIRQTNTKVRKGASGPLYYAYLWPSVDDMTNIYAADGRHMRMPDYYMDDDMINPLYGFAKNLNQDETDRAMARASLNFTPVKHTFIRAQAGVDFSASNYEISTHPYYRTYNLTSRDDDNSGSYNLSKHNLNNFNMDLLAGYNNTWGKFNFSAQVGYHQIANVSKTLAVNGGNFMVIDFHSINNCAEETITGKKSFTRRHLQAISGQMEFGYANMAYLTLRARNDWSSTLPVQNNSYFYPAIEGSFVVTELGGLKDTKGLSYLKLRAAVAQVGKDARPLSILPALETTGLSGGGYKYGFTGPNLTLRPEMTTSYEGGFEARFLDNRINLDFTYFHTQCEDQIVNGFRMSYATGFVLNNMNVGSFRTDGWEAHIDGDIIRRHNGLRWNVGLNVSHTNSEVTDLPENLTEYYNAYTWNSGNIRNGVMKGHPITTITGLAYQRNERGDILVSAGSGLPLVDSKWTVMGDRNPKLNFGFTTDISYKGFRFNALISGKLGATVVNGTMRTMLQKGMSWESVRLRESGWYTFKGVLKDGNENSDTPTPNNIALDLSHCGGTMYFAGDEDWVQKNVNYIRLQECRLSYTAPAAWLKRVTRNFVSGAMVFVAGNDLAVLSNYQGIDPVGNTMSAAAGGTGGEGYDVWGVPSPRSVSFGVSLTF